MGRGSPLDLRERSNMNLLPWNPIGFAVSVRMRSLKGLPFENELRTVRLSIVKET
jgi:hypothetical protein